MDAIISAVLEEICVEGAGGISLPNLWLRLQNHLSSAGLHPCNSVKQSIWNRLLNIPGMQFQARGSTFSPHDPSIRTVEASEILELKVVAPEHLRDSFLGISDQKLDNKHKVVRQMLERIAIARTNGITQNQLAKEFGMNGNAIFYPVRQLEWRQLIMRRSTIVRTKGPTIEDGKSENSTKSAPIATNLIHLCRYAKHLNLSSQQRLEITKPDSAESFGDVDRSLTGARVPAECSEEDVLVKDYLPALKAVCDKLEEASGKVLVVSDIKQALGYRKTPGHRAWRNVCNRLKDACLVEEFRAEVNKKVVNCLRLLKKFDPKVFRPKTVVCAYDDFDKDQPVKYGKMGQTTDQLVELPIDHQIYDMVDGEGSKGLTSMEVFKRLGLRRNYLRFTQMFSRFGMHIQTETYNKSKIYRIWTSRNFNCMEHPSIDEGEQLVISGTEPPNLSLEIFYKSHDAKTDTVNEEPKSDITPLGSTMGLSLSVPSKPQAGQRYPCLPTAISIQREQRILKRMQDEKFIIIAELYRWLDGLEKDKPTPMARKTLTRLLNKLQQEGQCKCVPVSVPVVTNCGRTRTTEVVLHPSIVGFPPELLCQIHEKLRIFEMRSRGHGLAKSKKDESVPVLTDVERTSTCISSDGQVKAEALRANGFVPAKLVRAKLLHNFLWCHLCSLPNWDDALSSGKHGYDRKNPHSTCKLFPLDAALKVMPLELFLQVVGSTQSFEDLLDSCRHGLRLSDLSAQEYNSLMTNHANERLSRVIDILIRLKLIQLVSGEHVGVMDKSPCAILTHALELKPYIEEPPFRALRSSRVKSSDLRPRIRHDFILLNKEAVDAYWKTLEYCYAAADPIAASCAFPGSAVQEVFLCRSWASARVMSADQRAELLKRLTTVEDKKISYNDCVKIATDLNLSLEQVLRFSHDKRQSRLPIFQGEQYPRITKNCGSITRKRKRSSEAKSSKYVKTSATGELRSRLPLQSDNNVMEDHETDLQTCDKGSHHNAVEEETNEEDGKSSFISQLTFSRLRPTRRRKFKWTEKADRQLIIQYARYRAALGAQYHRADWASISDLPAPPAACRRRMAMLNYNPHIRRAVIKLCNLLGERYAKHLNKINRKELMSNDDSEQTVQNSPLDESLSNSHANENDLGLDFEEYCWDDFEDENVKMALDEVIHYKRMAKPETSRRVGGSRCEKEWSDLPKVDGTNPNMDAHVSQKFAQGIQTNSSLVAEDNPAPSHDTQEAPGIISSSSPGAGIQNNVVRHEKDPQMLFFAGRRSSQRFLGKFQKLFSDECINSKVYRSLSIANAVELLKVAFLNRSAVPEVPRMLEGTLKRYSEHDIIAAFNYLREKKFTVVGHGSHPFVFSQKFWHYASSSPFPVNTGKRATGFAKLLHKREEELLENEMHLSADLQCGDIVHMFALVSSGELFISPSLPAEGIGEANEQSSKRRTDKRKSDRDEKAKKQRIHYSTDSELFYRREKGFPGIKVSISRATYSRVDAVEYHTNDVGRMSFCSHDQTYQSNSTRDLEPTGTTSLVNNLDSHHKTSSRISVAADPNECLWEAISSYAQCSTSKLVGSEKVAASPPKFFQTVHSAIREAGEQGLNMEEVSQVIFMQGVEMAESIVDMLLIFGLVIKVNAYDCVRALDASYRPKYLLRSLTVNCQDAKPASCVKSQITNNEQLWTLRQRNEKDNNTSQKDTTMNLCDGHKVTVLDFSEEDDQPHSEAQTNAGDNKLENYMQEEACSSEGTERETHICSDDLPTFRPILPWLNGDGSTNTIIYKGLTRRILGTVMQNPGISEEDVIHRMDVLNPQSCRKLLELLVLDNHLIVREMHQTTSCSPPAILGGLRRSRTASVFRKHFFANPMCTPLL